VISDDDDSYYDLETEEETVPVADKKRDSRGWWRVPGMTALGK
jgi:hypothetical protein